MTPVSHCKLIVALDFDHIGAALRFARRVSPFVDFFKVGSQLFTAEGPASVQALSRLGKGIFLDLKYHDIPNTVAAAIKAVALLPGVRLITLHASGGLDMMSAAAESVAARRNRPKLLAVTILTSLDVQALRRIGLAGSPEHHVARLARLAQKAGLDGVVVSAHEIHAVRRVCGPKFLIVVPGIRHSLRVPYRCDDQSRIASAAAAARAGADYIVVGRPITAATDPVAAARSIARQLALTSRD